MNFTKIVSPKRSWVVLSSLVMSSVLLGASGAASAATADADTPPILFDWVTGGNRDLLRLDWTSSETGSLSCHSEFYENRQCGTGDTIYWRNSDCAGQDLVPFSTYSFEADGMFTNTLPAQSLVHSGAVYNGTWEMINGAPVGSYESWNGAVTIQLGRYVEHLGGNTIAFYTSDTERLICATDDYRLKSISTSTPGQDEPDNGECDYSNADIHNGWGWNEGTGQSCAPIETASSDNDCDYTDAAENGGWGWNTVTLESCAAE